MTFDELVLKCKAGVYLSVNEHRDYYMSIEEWLTDNDADQETAARMSSMNAYRLQFYPDTPVGFYVVYGTSLQEVLDKAEKCF